MGKSHVYEQYFLSLALQYQVKNTDFRKYLSQFLSSQTPFSAVMSVVLKRSSEQELHHHLLEMQFFGPIPDLLD